MSRLLTLAAHDARLQFRSGIYAAYVFVIGFYGFVIVAAGPYLPPWAVGMVVYSDPAAVGFFFLGALMMLEKAESVRAALAVTPITAAQYFFAKVVTLSTVSFVACAVILVLLHGAANPALLLATAVMTSVTFIGVGTPIALRFRTVNAYLVGSSSFLIPVIAPSGLAMLDPMPAWLGLYPPIAQLRLLLLSTGYGAATWAEIALMLAVTTAAMAAAVVYAVRSLRRELGK
jgi:fluoroquinolone transport system permease protein